MEARSREIMGVIYKNLLEEFRILIGEKKDTFPCILGVSGRKDLHCDGFMLQCQKSSGYDHKTCILDEEA